MHNAAEHCLIQGQGSRIPVAHPHSKIHRVSPGKDVGFSIACQPFKQELLFFQQNEVADLITADTGKTTADAIGSVQRGLRK